MITKTGFLKLTAMRNRGTNERSMKQMLARLMRVSVKTLQNWEQHRRNPTGPAAALLKIVSTAPEVALKSLHA